MAKTKTRTGPRASNPRRPTKAAYRSGFEKRGAEYLRGKKVAFGYESVRLSYTVPATKRTYVPDFQLPNGVLVEFKGRFDRDARQKMALVIEQNPDKDIRLLFMRDNKIAKGSKTKYTDWCRQRGIACAVSSHGHIPDDWL